MMQLNMLYMVIFHSSSLKRLVESFGVTISKTQLTEAIRRDPDAASFNKVTLVAKSEASKLNSTLLSNFVTRWSHKPSFPLQPNKDQHLSFPFAVPPATFSALVLPNIHGLFDLVMPQMDGQEKTMSNCFEDQEYVIASRLCQAFADALFLLARPPVQSLFHAKGHCDLLLLIAGVANQLSKVVHEWGAARRGLRWRAEHDPPVKSMSMSAPPTALSLPFVSNNFNTSDTLYTYLRQSALQDGQDFEMLLQKILSTPVI